MRFYWQKLVFIALMAVLLLNCDRRPNIKSSNAIYYWQQQGDLTPFEKQFVAENNINTVYLKLFDVDKRPGEKFPQPHATVELDSLFASNFKTMIPVVFITNRTFLEMSVSEIDTLVQKIGKKIDQLTQNYTLAYNQLQFDCDWSSKTKNNYFYFLKKIKNYFSPKIISCTIRLHQIKYFKNTGIPDVDRGMLMFYNMGDVKKTDEVNSILTYSEGKKYTDKLREYPLQLDIVLPAFSWGVIFRNNKFAGIWNEASLEQLNNTGDFEPLGKFNFKVKQNIEKYYLYKNDIIRWENSEIEEIEKSAAWLRSNLPNDSLSVTLFHLKEEKLLNYDKKELHTIYNTFN